VITLDVEQTIDEFIRLGRLDEDLQTIDARLHSAVEGIGLADAIGRSVGIGDWAAQTVRHIKAAVHLEICNAGGGVKRSYRDLLDTATSKEALSAISSIVAAVMTALHLTPIAVSAVVVYMAIWILKTGLNYWCSLPASVL